MGAAFVSLHAFVPETVLDLALAVMAIGIVGLSVPLLRLERVAPMSKRRPETGSLRSGS